MLNSPHEFVLKIGNTNYYYLNIQDVPYRFLVAEVFEPIVGTHKRFLRKPKYVRKDLQIAVKTMPMNSLFLFVMHNALTKLGVVTYELDVEEKKVDIYKSWTDSDVFDLQNDFVNFLESVRQKTNYSVPKVIKNPVAKGFDKDGYSFFALETVSGYSRTYWLIRTTQTGALHFVAVNEVGTKDKPITMSVDHMLLDRKLLVQIMEDFKNGKLNDVEEEKTNVEDTTKEGE